MSKRELGALAMDVDVGGPRAKRRKDTVTPTTGVNEASGVSSRVTGMNGEDVDMVEASGSNGQESASVKELGLQVWHTVREAVNKNNIIPSPPFMRLPPKRVYPDYYTIISQPVCLDDIKKRLDTAKYHTFDELKADFDLCFDNAKEYNLKGSELWEDAKFLQKTVHKELGKITGKKDKKQKKEGHGEEQDGDEDDGQKKNKPSTMKRLLKARLQKLIEKTNDEGRILSNAFMELPPKKLYPTYYTIIKKPQAFDIIFKHLDRKEYPTANDFAADVELVFSNAQIFNQEHSRIWEDAVTLRDYFYQLMSDLPSPYALPQYSKPTIGKLKLRVPASSAAATALANVSSRPAVPTITLRVPAPNAKSSEPKSATSPPSKTGPQSEAKAPSTKPAPTEAPPAKMAPTKATQAEGPSAKTKTTPMKAAPARPPSPVKAQPAKAPTTKPPAAKSPLTTALPTPAVPASTPSQSTQLSQSKQPPTAPPAVALSSKSAPKSIHKPTPTPAPTPAAVPTPVSVPKKTATPPVPPPARPANQQPAKSATPVQAPPKVLPYSTAPQFSSHYPNAAYHQRSQIHAPTPVFTPTQSQAPVIAAAQQPVVRTPPPSLDGRRPLKWVCLTTRPRGRAIMLDRADGVRSWALVLGQSEKSLTVAGVTFLEEEGDEDGGTEEVGEDHAQKQVTSQAQEEEEEEEEEEPVPKKRKRGRPAKNAAKAKAAAPAPAPAPAAAPAPAPSEKEKPVPAPMMPMPTPDSVHVLLNGSAVGHQAGQQGLWMMDLQAGSNVIEVGEKGGHTWKVYLERL